MKSPSRRPFSGFTLIEVICVVAIVILLAGLISPAMKSMTSRAEAVTCANNLRQLSVAMAQKVQENNGVYPNIEIDPENPIYPPEAGAETLAEILKPFGITEAALRCPADVRKNNHFASKGCSYEWFPLVAGETTFAPNIYLPAGVLTLPTGRMPLAADFNGVHFRKQNVLFADGHVELL